MNEVMARALSEEEVASRYRDHADPGVQKLALHVLGETPIGREIQELEEEAETARLDAENAQCLAESYADLLQECLDELSSGCEELRARIKAALK